MSEAPEFDDLVSQARARARYDNQFYGSCPACQLGPTAVTDFCNVIWGTCEFCATRWAISNEAKAPKHPLDDDVADDDETLFELARALAYYDDHIGGDLVTKQNRQDPAPAANAAIEELERATLGSLDIQDAVSQAGAAIAALRNYALARLFPLQVEPISDVIGRDFEIFTRHFSHSPVTKDLIALHEQSIDTHPELAACIRGSRGQALLRARCNIAVAQAEEKAYVKFTTAIAEQCHARNLFAPWPEHLTNTVPALVARLDRVKVKHEEFALSEAARLKAEADAAAAARVDQERLERERDWPSNLVLEDREARQRREELIASYRRHDPRFRFRVGTRTVGPEEAASELERGAPYFEYFRARATGELPMRVWA